MDEFQFHKGTIRTEKTLNCSCVCNNFNSIKVRLERMSAAFPFVCQLYFNSIKVRLEHEYQEQGKGILSFQFHNGTIRTDPAILRYICYKHFNSIKVRLEHWIPRNRQSNDSDFNSIKVRLEPSPYYELPVYWWFQFHKGTIRTTKSFSLLSFLSSISIP